MSLLNHFAKFDYLRLIATFNFTLRKLILIVGKVVALVQKEQVSNELIVHLALSRQRTVLIKTLVVQQLVADLPLV